MRSTLARDVSAIAAAAVAIVAMCACSATPSAGFWMEGDTLTLPPGAATRLGGPLTNAEIVRIDQLARSEIRRAFQGLRLAITTNRHALWRVVVMQSLRTRRNQPLPHAGESMAMGFLGGSGGVNFEAVAAAAIFFAPLTASRDTVFDGIGRGIGRVAVHELMHEILGASSGHNDLDTNSYEYGSPDRHAQYYGALHWTSAWPRLRDKLGEDDGAATVK
jgi:hypothetical protein